MNDQESLLKARELLAVEFERKKIPSAAQSVRNGDFDHDAEIRAIIAALRANAGDKA